MDNQLIVYVFLTLLGLYSLAQKLAPVVDRSLEGCRVSYVYDGDTVALICPNGEETARNRGFDTPETKSPGCVSERALGLRATTRLRSLVAQDGIEIAPYGREKYGRLLIGLSVQGRDVGDTLIDEGLAVAYRGGSRINWCERLE